LLTYQIEMPALHEKGTIPATPISFPTLQRKAMNNRPALIISLEPKEMDPACHESVTELSRSSDKSASETSKCSGTSQSIEDGSSLLSTELNRFQAELKIRIASYGEDHPKVAETMNVLGLYYHHMAKDYSTALFYHQRALHVLTSWESGCLVEDIAVTLTDIGNIQDLTGDHEGALKSFR